MAATTKVAVSMTEGAKGLTLGELRSFIGEADRAGISDDSLIVDAATRGIAKLKKLAVEG